MFAQHSNIIIRYVDLCCYAWEAAKDGAPGLGQSGIPKAHGNFFVIAYNAPDGHDANGKSSDESRSASDHTAASESADDEKSGEPKAAAVVAGIKKSMKKFVAAAKKKVVSDGKTGAGKRKKSVSKAK